MSPRVTGRSPARVLRQLRHDHRTLALLLVLPCLVLALLRWMFDATAGRPSTPSGRRCWR